jgi:hypothetical protein
MLLFLSLYTVKQVHTQVQHGKLLQGKHFGNRGARNIILWTNVRLEYNNITALLQNVYK